MKNFRNGFNIFLIALICIPNLEALEVKFANELNFEVNRVYPYIVVNKTNLNDAKKLSDVYARYESSWVKSYISVVISTCVKGNIKSESSKNDILTNEQKVLMAGADAGAPIHVHVNYMPENTLKHNDPKEFHFS
ncbi:MAG: energy transducer TonB, partial [Saprospiraceae bacterium]